MESSQGILVSRKNKNKKTRTQMLSMLPCMWKWKTIFYVYVCKFSEIKLLSVVISEEGDQNLRMGRKTYFSLSVFYAVFIVTSIRANKAELLWRVPFAVSCYLVWHLKYSEVKRAFHSNSWEEIELLAMGQETGHQLDSFITCSL